MTTRLAVLLDQWTHAHTHTRAHTNQDVHTDCVEAGYSLMMRDKYMPHVYKYQVVLPADTYQTLLCNVLVITRESCFESLH